VPHLVVVPDQRRVVELLVGDLALLVLRALTLPGSLLLALLDALDAA
jgi:hypothetical protein